MSTRTKKQVKVRTEREQIDDLGRAVDFVNTFYPLPRCRHGHALKDHAGERLEPSCGCRSGEVG